MTKQLKVKTYYSRTIIPMAAFFVCVFAPFSISLWELWQILVCNVIFIIYELWGQKLMRDTDFFFFFLTLSPLPFFVFSVSQSLNVFIPIRVFFLNISFKASFSTATLSFDFSSLPVIPTSCSLTQAFDSLWFCVKDTEH